MKSGKGRPFLEILSSALNEDYRFPILEVFAFLFALSTFVQGRFGLSGLGGTSVTGVTGDSIAFSLFFAVATGPILIFFVLILKNIAFGLGGDLEKGIIQTILSYPLKRSRILTAKLLSAFGMAFLLSLGTLISALYVLAPGIVGPHLGTVLLTSLTFSSYVLLFSTIVLLATMRLRRGGIGLILGIVLFFAFPIVQVIVSSVADATRSPLPLQVFSVVYPIIALTKYYGTGLGPSGVNLGYWTPSFSEVLGYIAACYGLIFALLTLSYFYFSRRLNL